MFLFKGKIVFEIQLFIFPRRQNFWVKNTSLVKLLSGVNLSSENPPEFKRANCDRIVWGARAFFIIDTYNAIIELKVNLSRKMRNKIFKRGGKVKFFFGKKSFWGRKRGPRGMGLMGQVKTRYVEYHCHCEVSL